MSEENVEGSKLQVRTKAVARSLFDLYEPDLSTGAGAREFLARLRAVAEPESKKTFKDFFALKGVWYYVAYAGVVAVLLVAVIFSLLYKLGPAGGYDTRWVVPEAAKLLLIIMGLEYLCWITVWSHREIVGVRFSEPPPGYSADQTTMSEPEGGRAEEATLRLCVVELKYLVDTLNDRVGTLNQAMSYLIPSLVAVQVFSLLLPGADDKTPISFVTFGATLLAGFIALFFALPIRLVAHGRVRRYRAWLRKVETALLELGNKAS